MCTIARPVFLAILTVWISTGVGSNLFGQPMPDRWNNVTNPSGLRIVPALSYDSLTGVVSIDTRGLDGVSQTPNASTIGGTIQGDDVGLIALLVQTPISGGTYFPRFDGMDLEQFLVWSSMYFNGKYQAVGMPLASTGNQFLWPGVYDYVQLPPGLPLSSFGSVEIAVNFAPNRPGAVLFCSGNCILPEPASVVLLGWMALVFLGVCRPRSLYQGTV